ncbi:CcdB family protein [Pseudochelatococcus sp. B33]
MAQFDVYAGVGRQQRYVVDVQADLLEGLATRVVAPLVPRAEASVVNGLTPVVAIDGVEFVVLMPELVAIPLRELPQRVGTLSAFQDALKRSLDILFIGF